jgi:hypothetical protein
MRQPSPKIIRDSQDCDIINMDSHFRVIADELYLIIAADVAASTGGVYRVLIYRSKRSGRDWSTCNCTGFLFTFMCKHVYAVEDRAHNTKSVDYDNL